MLLPIILFAIGVVTANADNEVFYFTKGIYTKCPLPDFTWTIEGEVSGPWIVGTMHAQGQLIPLTGTYPNSKVGILGTPTFDFTTSWTITSDTGKILLAASCQGTASTKKMPSSPNAPWWEECKITDGNWVYATYIGHHILTSGFFPPDAGVCVENVSFMSGYKIVVD
jgi:hypothetical protein